MPLPQRKHPRLCGYDYSSEGIYFLTICTAERNPILSKIIASKTNDTASLLLTEFGKIAEQYIHSISAAYPNTTVLSYVIMPDHIHLLLQLKRRAESSRPTVPQVIAAFKRFTNRDCGERIWQDGYYDHIVRSEEDLIVRMEYIETNPLRKLLKSNP